MKKLVSFRTDAENKAMLISKARELGLPLSEYIDQITTEFHFDEKDESSEGDGNVCGMLLRGLYLRTQLFEMYKLIRTEDWKRKSQNEKEMLLQSLIEIILKTYAEQKKMLAEEAFQ
jgi:hypothetical protein